MSEFALTPKETAEALLDWIIRNRGYTTLNEITVYWKPTRSGIMKVTIKESADE